MLKALPKGHGGTQGDAVDEFHDDRGPVGLLDVLVEACGVRVAVHQREETGLVPEPGDEVAVG